MKGRFMIRDTQSTGLMPNKHLQVKSRLKSLGENRQVFRLHLALKEEECQYNTSKYVYRWCEYYRMSEKVSISLLISGSLKWGKNLSPLLISLRLE